MRCKAVGGSSSGHSGDKAGRRCVSVIGEAAATACKRENGEGGRRSSSHRMQQASKRARGSAGGSESTAMISGGRRGKQQRWRRCSVSGTSWLGGEEEGVEAEPLSATTRRGSGYGHGGARHG